MKKNTTVSKKWSEQGPIAVSVSVMLEGWADQAAPGLGPMGNLLRADVLDLQARNWAEYGPNEGAPRLLDVLARYDLEAVFYTSGIIVERHAALVREIKNAGHHVAGHSWTQNMIPAYLKLEDEIRDIERCSTIIEQAAGQKPQGWISPRCTPSASTSRLLVEAGYKWHADIFDADLPYRLQTDAGAITAMPFTMEVNDMPLYVRYGNEPEAYSRILKRIVGKWKAAGNTPFCLDLTVHAHVFGRPAGIIELIECIEFLKSSAGNAWLTNHAELSGMVENRI